MRRIEEIPAISIVKFDRSWVQCFENPEKHEFLSRTVTSVKKLGKMVIAEGIERPDQLDAAKGAGFEIFQGYLFNPQLRPS